MNLRQVPATILVMMVGTQLALSMGIEQLMWLALIASGLLGMLGSGLVAPTAILASLICVMSAIAGYQLFGELSIGHVWIEDHPLFAGVCLGFYFNLLWLLSAMPRRAQREAPHQVTQYLVIVSFGLFFIVPHPVELSWAPTEGHEVSLLAPLVLLLGMLVLFGQRITWPQQLRLLLVLPPLVMMPFMSELLVGLKGPVTNLASSLTPKSFQSGNRIGFSPFQSLNSQLFRQGTAKVVMRVRYPSNRPFYLVGNRHMFFDSEEFLWHSGDYPVETLLPSGVGDDNLNYFHVNDNVAPPFGHNKSEVMQITSLLRDDAIFLPAASRTIRLPLSQLSIDERRVWQGSFREDEERTWNVTFNGPSAPIDFDKRTLELPELWDAVLAEYSQQFAGESRLSIVRNILSHFSDKEYSLDVDINERYPLHDFLINRKAAFCYWYATAATLMLRENGVPARLVSGYFVDTQVSTGMWLVHDRDAHAWVEWQDEAGYWHTLDPTPPSLFDYRDGFAKNYVSILFHLLSDRFEEVDRFVNEMEAGAKQWLILVGLIILLFLFLREYRRIRETHSHERKINFQWGRVWRKFLLATQLPDEPSWSEMDYLRHLPKDWDAEYRASVMTFFQQYSQERFSPNQSPPSAELRAHVQNLKNLAKTND